MVTTETEKMPIHHSKQFLAIAFSLLTATLHVHGSKKQKTICKTNKPDIEIINFEYKQNRNELLNILKQTKNETFGNNDSNNDIEKKMDSIFKNKIYLDCKLTIKIARLKSNNKIIGYVTYTHDQSGNIVDSHGTNKRINYLSIDNLRHLSIDNTYIFFLAVDENYRKKGIGKKLLHVAFKSTNPYIPKNLNKNYRQYKEVSIPALQTNKTVIEFYEKNNFKCYCSSGDIYKRTIDMKKIAL